MPRGVRDRCKKALPWTSRKPWVQGMPFRTKFRSKGSLFPHYPSWVFTIPKNTMHPIAYAHLGKRKKKSLAFVASVLSTHFVVVLILCLNLRECFSIFICLVFFSVIVLTIFTQTRHTFQYIAMPLRFTFQILIFTFPFIFWLCFSLSLVR